MLKYKIISLCLFGFIYSQCSEMNESTCNSDDSCSWVESIEQENCFFNNTSSECNNNENCAWMNSFVYGNCSNISGMGDCNSTPGCNYSTLTYTCDGQYLIADNSYCTGGDYEIDNSYCEEIEVLECSEMNYFSCNDGINCEWIEDISYGSCGSLTVSQCYDYPGQCYVDSNPGWYDSSGPYCTGGTYQINNSYCQEIEILECSEMDSSQCSSDDGCDWVEDVETGNCSDLLFENDCNSASCSWEYGCLEMGWWYNWCYTYGYECVGGTYQIDDGYCEESSAPEYQLGDINNDYTINILDAIVMVNMILDGEFDRSADMNEDESVDILDIVELINIILSGEGL